MKKLTFHHAEIKHKPNIAVYVDVFLQDENGNVYQYHTAAFEHDLKICPTLREPDTRRALDGGGASDNRGGL